MKKCFRCKKEKDESEFYSHKKMRDGLLGKCKECTKKDNILNREKNKEYYKEYDKARAMLPHRVKARKEYIKNNPYIKTKADKKYRTKFPEKYKAVNAVNNALRCGRLFKKPCAICENEITEAHHEDYSKPLEVIWLCAKHHAELHKNRRKNNGY